MDPRRKKIYIWLIIGCWVVSAGIFGWSYFSNPSASTDVTITTPNNAGLIEASGNVTDGFFAPSVFPATNSFNTALFESESFRQLRTFTPVDVTGQLGRPDPFTSY